MRFRWLVLAALCSIAAVPPPVSGHHSHAIFDTERWVTLEGAVLRVQWLFPHAWIYLEVEDEQGQAQIWAMEGANPNSIQLAGVSRDHIRPGDRISARCHPLRDGSTGCVLGFVTPMHGDPARGHGVERAWN